MQELVTLKQALRAGKPVIGTMLTELTVTGTGWVLYITPSARMVTPSMPVSSWISKGSASVTFPAGALSATGEVTVRLAVLDPSSAAARAAFPGGFATGNGDMLESFGALGIEVRDLSEQLVNLAAGQTAQIVIPVTSGAPDTIPLWSFSETAGTWTQEGSLAGCADGVCDSASINHLSWWNADQVLETTCIRVCVQNQDGSVASGVSVYASGYDYNGDSSGTTGEDGCL